MTGARTWVVCPSLTREQAGLSRSPGSRRDEAVGLARAIDLTVVGAEIVSLGAVRPAAELVVSLFMKVRSAGVVYGNFDRAGAGSRLAARL